MNSKYNNICIHIQTHTPHFEYTDKLINSLLTLTNILYLKIPIFIIVDNRSMIDNFKNRFKYEYEKIYFLCIDEIINNIKLEITEKYNELFKNVIDIQWGAGEHRNYVAVKRIYSILELEQKGYSFIWCLDSESLVLKNVDIENIIVHNIQKPLLTISKNHSNCGIQYPQIIEQLFTFKYGDYKDISVRMNDFWFIHTNYFSDMINMLFEIHKKPISYFINGSEQSVYEYYIYSLYLKDNNTINLIEFDSDLHGNSLFNSAINSNIDLKSFCENMNNKYFNYVQSYRGDFYKQCLNSIRGTELIKRLNISIAVSNYSGF